IPPAASMTDAAIMTARMISMTSIGGLVGARPNTYVSTKTPKLPHNPRPTPPYRLPITMQASTTANSRQLSKVSISNSLAAWCGCAASNLRQAQACPGGGQSAPSGQQTSAEHHGVVRGGERYRLPDGPTHVLVQNYYCQERQNNWPLVLC